MRAFLRYGTGVQRLAISFAILLPTLLSYPAQAQVGTDDPFGSWLERELAKAERHLAEARQLENDAERNLLRAKDIRSRVSSSDTSLLARANEAVEIATADLNRAKADRQRDEGTVTAVKAAIKLNKECNDLRVRAVNDRRALMRQGSASSLVAEGSASQPTLLAARTGMAAARLALLANQFSKYNRLMLDVVQNIDFIARHPEADTIGLTAPTLQTMASSWNRLNTARAGEDCKDHLKAWSTYSHLMQNGVALGKCAEFLAKLGEFLRVHHARLEKIGTVLGVAVSTLEFMNEVRELHEDVKAIEDQTRSNPERALEAQRRLDERMKSTLDKIALCQGRLVAALDGIR